MPQKIEFKAETIRGIVDSWDKHPKMSFFEYDDYVQQRISYFALITACIYF